MFAATAIGVSHLVQSTSAGANFGFSLLIFIVIANVFKYPFFEYGTRYAAATGKSIIEGYNELNPIWLKVYLLVTFCSMFFVTAAVGIVAIGFMEHLFGLSELVGFSKATHFVLFIGTAVLLIFGRFNVLENTVKILGVVLFLTTLFAFSITLIDGPQGVVYTVDLFPEFTPEMWAFVLPLMGWMPTALDLSTWNSLWTIEKIKSTGYKPSVKESVKEFGLGYWLSAVLAIMFLVIGAFLVFNTGQVVPTKSATFSAFVVNLYQVSLGEWASLIVGSATFSIMFSTFITILDGYSRSLSIALPLVFSRFKSPKTIIPWVVLALTIVGLILIIAFENNPDGFRVLINTATTLSFIVAPAIAILNYRLVMKDKIGQENSPNGLMRLLSWLGILYLFAFLIWFLFF